MFSDVFLYMLLISVSLFFGVLYHRRRNFERGFLAIIFYCMAGLLSLAIINPYFPQIFPEEIHPLFFYPPLLLGYGKALDLVSTYLAKLSQHPQAQRYLWLTLSCAALTSFLYSIGVIQTLLNDPIIPPLCLVGLGIMWLLRRLKSQPRQLSSEIDDATLAAEPSKRIQLLELLSEGQELDLHPSRAKRKHQPDYEDRPQ